MSRCGAKAMMLCVCHCSGELVFLLMCQASLGAMWTKHVRGCRSALEVRLWVLKI